MKLKYKTLIIIGLTWIPFIFLGYFQARSGYVLGFTATAIIFASLNFILLRWEILDRINNLIQLTGSQKSSLHHIKIKGDDELTEIGNNFTSFARSLKSSHKKLEQDIQKNSHDMLNKNAVLEKEISKRTYVEKMLLSKNAPSIDTKDALTDLPNRYFFSEILSKAISHAKRHKKILAVLLIDIDDFNDTTKLLGHSKSQLVLKEIAKRFSTTLRSEDILAKLEGDEFIVLLNDIGKAKFAGTVSEKILQSLAEPIKMDAHDLFVNVSIGISIFPNDGTSLEDILKNVYNALYQAKHANKGNYQFYAQETDVEAREYIQLESSLRNAMHNNQLILYYQPKIHLKEGNISGIEALIRWEHPALGLIDPARFIPIAEETGLIMQIGEWILREACRTNKFWQDEGYEHLTVSVNISPKQFHHPDFAKSLATVLKETGLDPRYLELEINESTLMENTVVTEKILEGVKSTGVQICIDHFGTGYTSISHLKKFPVSSIKLDRYFTKGIPNKPDDMAITTAIIALAHNLGLEVIAEGIETAEQVQYLAEQNCDMVQGYFLSHPLPALKIVLQFSKLRDDALI